MTNRERLVSLLGFTPDKASIEGALIDAGIDGTQDYTKDNAGAIKLGALELMKLLLSTPDQSNETGYSVKYDRDAIEQRIRLFEIEAGMIEETPTPRVRFIRRW